ncbi:flavin reductase family protein [Nocardia abscessus]|uniref:flavin reductase family protein n=1 Tax=Nocardia abscessus TaxID=120957 RepID=UPI002458ACB7|nr:flavin reductase [Nocardia abscessus]
MTTAPQPATAAPQATVATAPARRGPDKFDRTAWTASQDLPRLPDSTAWVAAGIDQYVTAGDQTVLPAHVTAAEVGAHDPRPLTDHRRSFGTHTPQAT